MGVALRPAAISPAVPVAVSQEDSQTGMMAVTHQDPAACIPLLPAAFPVLLPGVVAAVLVEPGPEPPGWPVTAPPGTSGPPDVLPPGVRSGHSVPTSPGLSACPLTWLHSTPILWGHPRSKIRGHRIPL